MPPAPKLKVLFVEQDKAKADIVLAALDAAQYQVSHLPSAGVSLLKEVDKAQPDLIIMDLESPSRDVIENLNLISSLNPKPVVMLSEQYDRDTISTLVKSGVSAYVVGDVNAERVKSVIDVAMARFEEYQQLKTELQQAKQALGKHKALDQAKAWLMESRQLSEREAYQCMRKMAMNQGKKIEEVASDILSLAAALDS
ncbi:MAG: ANTAR domain-containing protein [Cellvibrionaceae bacterium]|nr:ANTAR domain-containing protein [Cellvibrionaceae bacterium]MCV6624503.1 ANTAR domain-containing protein [Cellvibrionaceae bacterium]